MGVRDLFPSLRRLVPQSIQPLASLSELGYPTKFAIDGNLLTTKFHFSPPSPPPPSSSSATTDRNPDRHVQSWYSFLRELEKRRIGAVIVFDGPGRKSEKERERERRRDARELQRRRGEAEAIRTLRLRTARKILDDEKTTVPFSQEQERVRRRPLDDEVKVDESNSKKPWNLLEQLRREYERDKTNPVYSKNQELITREEGQFYDLVLSRFSTHVGSQTVRECGEPRSERFEPTEGTATLSETLPPISSTISSQDNLQSESRSAGSLLSELAVTTNEPESVPTIPTVPSQAFPSDTLEAVSIAASFPSTPPINYPPSSSSSESTGLPASPDLMAEHLSLSAPFCAPPATERDSAATYPAVEEVEATEPLVEFDLDSLISKSFQMAKSHLSRSVSVPSQVFSDVKDLISSMGYPILTPSSLDPIEAESICSLLYHESSLTGVTHVVSEDTDVLVYSARLLRRISTYDNGLGEKRKKRGYSMSVTDPKDILEGLGLDREEFLDWCLMCGTDFTDRLPGLGPAKALGLIRKYRSIENAFAQPTLRKKYFLMPDQISTGVDQPPSEPEARTRSIETYDDWMKRITDARQIFLESRDLTEVIRSGEAINVYDDEAGPPLASMGSSLSSEAGAAERCQGRRFEEDGVELNWFEKKDENTRELERLKRKFGISDRWTGAPSSWVDLEAVVAEEAGDVIMNEELFDDDDLDEVLEEAEFFRRYDIEEAEGLQEMDDRAAEVWLREQEGVGA